MGPAGQSEGGGVVAVGALGGMGGRAGTWGGGWAQDGSLLIRRPGGARRGGGACGEL